MRKNARTVTNGLTVHLITANGRARIADAIFPISRLSSRTLLVVSAGLVEKTRRRRKSRRTARREFVKANCSRLAA